MCVQKRRERAAMLEVPAGTTAMPDRGGPCRRSTAPVASRLRTSSSTCWGTRTATSAAPRCGRCWAGRGCGWAGAPIFEISDFDVVGDLFSIAPQLQEEISKRHEW